MAETFLRVYGDPAPQGSKRAIPTVGRGGRVRVSLVESSKRVRPWRDAVVAAALAQPSRPRHAGAVGVVVRFFIPRPKSHYGSGRNAGVVRASAPPFPTSRAVGDLDKLQRSTFDGLTDTGVVVDDSHIVMVDAWKLWADDPADAGAVIRVVDVAPGVI